jgi:hypothetical protein
MAQATMFRKSLAVELFANDRMKIKFFLIVDMKSEPNF